MAGSKRLAAQFIDQKTLRVHAGNHVKSAKVLAVGCFHADVTGCPSVRGSGRQINVCSGGLSLISDPRNAEQKIESFQVQLIVFSDVACP